MVFHFLRPWWLLIVVPFIPLLWKLYFSRGHFNNWRQVCDAHLLPFLIKTQNVTRSNSLIILLASIFLLMIISLAGPTWSQLPVPTFKKINPKIIVLDMSDVMQNTDLSPDRLSRAKFKLHDLFQKNDTGQFGLVVYTGEPFVVSPLTDDAKTIDALLPNLTLDIMPVEGNNLDMALNEASGLIKQAGFSQGDILVLTAKAPSKDAIRVANNLSAQKMVTSVLPIIPANQTINPAFKQFANSGKGLLLQFSDTSSDIDTWLKFTDQKRKYKNNDENSMPIWRDQGRWFLIPVIILLLPFFRRGSRL